MKQILNFKETKSKSNYAKSIKLYFHRFLLLKGYNNYKNRTE